MNKDNSAINQRQRLLKHLKKHGSITSNEARVQLDIYHPPARIKELRDDGNKIDTVWVTWTSEYDTKHRIAKYVLPESQPLDHLKHGEVSS